MKKVLLITLTALLMVMLASSVAMAIEPYYHGDFATDSTGCAKCHVTHAGFAKALLISGPTQTQFCYYCHNGVSKSPYDVENGKIDTAGGLMPSLAGGFGRSFNFDDAANTYDIDAGTGGGDDANFIASTSKHGVESYDSNDWATGGTLALIPGATTNQTDAFRCGSCHNPHAGGTYPIPNAAANTRMPRLLKDNLFGVNFDPANHGDWSFTVLEGAGTTDTAVTVVQEYGQNVGVWCAGCHDLFNQTAHDAGQAAVNNAGTGGTNKYMHRMNFQLTNPGDIKAGHNVIQKLALSNNIGTGVNNYLTCLTCHRAHGTASVSTLAFDRATNYKKGTGAAAGNTQTSSVLLRETNRDVCYNCHLDATKNRPQDQ